MDVAGRACTRCGVAVPAGYPRCPRCHAELPVATAGRGRAAGGGTAVDGPGGSRTPLYAAIGGGAALIALVAWLALRGDDATKTAPGEPSDTTSEDPDDPAPAASGVEAPAVPEIAQRPEERAAVARTTAINGLVRAMRDERVYASVQAEGDVVMIQSGMCEDKSMGATVDASASDLRAVGFTMIRCRAPHGQIMFERAP